LWARARRPPCILGWAFIISLVSCRHLLQNSLFAGSDFKLVSGRASLASTVSSIQWHAHMRHPRLWRPPRIQYRCPIFTPSRHLRQTHDSTPLPAPPSYCREPHLRMEISSPCPPLLLGPPRPSGSQGLVRPPPSPPLLLGLPLPLGSQEPVRPPLPSSSTTAPCGAPLQVRTSSPRVPTPLAPALRGKDHEMWWVWNLLVRDLRPAFSHTKHQTLPGRLRSSNLLQ
jgi:hypothetical protein